jgi:Anti-sigma factor NepR
MAQKDIMETLVTHKPPHTEDGAKAQAGHASTATHKALITRNLRLVYGEVAGEQVPDRIMDLLDQLADRKDQKS